MTNEEIEREAADLAQIADMSFAEALTRKQRLIMQDLVARGIAFGLRKFVSQAYEEAAQAAEAIRWVAPVPLDQPRPTPSHWIEEASHKAAADIRALKASLVSEPVASAS